MSEDKKFEVSFDDKLLKLSIDSNLDGEKLIDVKVDLNEAVQEILKRGDKVEGIKIVQFDFSLSKLILKIDSDQDGEELLSVELNLAEALDEAGIGK